MASPKTPLLPDIVAHADWSAHPGGRWLATARRRGDGYEVAMPAAVADPGTLIAGVRERATGGAVLAGFDFPIGLPAAYARRAGVTHFPTFLRRLGASPWERFFAVASDPGEIAIHRPFYPARPGSARHRHLLDGLGLSDMAQLLRKCERRTADRPAAAHLFWTLGAKQVGKAAISGWRDVLRPALIGAHPVRLWPFDGPLEELLEPGLCVVAETYPADACVQLGLGTPGRGWSKRRQADRSVKGDALLRWADRRPVRFEEDLRRTLVDGFGPAGDGENPFDAVVGLCGMLEVVLGLRTGTTPADADITSVEGWILGQAADEPAN